jgi:hypothetical protein
MAGVFMISLGTMVALVVSLLVLPRNRRVPDA